MSDPAIPRIRRAGVPDDALFVLRGDALDPESLRRDALRFHRRYAAWRRYGVSEFYATSDAEVEALCETRLVHFSIVVVFRRAELEAGGIEIAPTFRTARHPGR